ncbi:MAG TPA: RagB/SusD family nutrient uptake outer membrane protein [Chitinophaga sp.]|uniref:RagB/SusD family nutrient uptake outer membrane protein n=1 Tax=Chitinophaga sp. TaxID=1869181 RepID=UPI002C6B2C5F|nr:RagB/SusD family nutrient uptake outer membrane protein [Chitinophaga sp.]HVI44332.1 RagB/SusD family nutrient uptake outer membrane protein [Chitinophaga sp.]
MKRKIIYAAGLVLAMSATSCKKYLDVVPVGKVIPKTVEDYNRELNACYAQGDFDKSLTTYRTDEVKLDESRSGDVDRVVNHFRWDENGSNTNTLTFDWQHKYLSVFYANHVIAEGPTATEGSEAQRNQLVGEAYLLRAYLYFNLVNLYGNTYNPATMAADKAVPLITKVDMEQVARRNTVKEIYDQIFADLEKGRSLVNVNAFETASSYKFGKIAADALAARIYLYTRQWDKALAAANAALEKKGTLTDLNNSSVLPTQYDSPESILAYEMIYSTNSIRPIFVSPAFLAMYDQQGDLRAKLFYGKDAKGNATLVKVRENNKFRQSFRVAEMYLIAAEAAAQLQQVDAARTTLNTLKKKRLTPAFYATEEARVALLSGNALLTEIYNERARELSFEGHRWFDLRRTTQPAITHMVKGQSYTLNAGDPRYTIRIPKAAIENNPLLNE